MIKMYGMVEDSKLMTLCRRWSGLLRHKASEYEHKARGEGEIVTSPSLDALASEIEAFLIGLESGN